MLGGDAIRRVVLDPLLPAPIVDMEARRAMVEITRRYDVAGRALWKRFFVDDDFAVEAA